MKKVLIILLLIAGGIFAYEHWGAIEQKFPLIKNSFQEGTLLEDIAREVITSGPLRSKVDSPNSHLTVSGVISWTNDRRVLNSRPPLKENAQLNAAAEAKVKDMFASQYFEHISPTGKGPSDLAQKAGYAYVAVGENLALGNFEDDNTLVEAWMNSPGHRENILSGKFTEIGVAVAKGLFEGKETWLAVQEFGKPTSECPSVDESLKIKLDSYRRDADFLQNQVQTKKAELEQSPEPTNQAEYDEYNKKVSEYNALVKAYNNKVDLLKQLTEQYNGQVKAFNECVRK